VLDPSPLAVSFNLKCKLTLPFFKKKADEPKEEVEEMQQARAEPEVRKTVEQQPLAEKKESAAPTPTPAPAPVVQEPIPTSTPAPTSVPVAQSQPAKPTIK